MDYQEFLESKICLGIESGFDISDNEIFETWQQIPEKPKKHHYTAIKWAIKGGKRAIFLSFGMGKTIVQLEIVRLILKHKGGKVLIVCPLGVKPEFTHDASYFLGLKLEYVKSMQDIHSSTSDILITNYERVRDGDIDPKFFTATTLDEAAVLRSYGSLTYQTFLNKFNGVKFKFVATASPSPNKFKELIHYAGYLEQMDTGQALTRFFKRDSTQANNLTIHPHKEEEFWLWVSTWGLFAEFPSDLGGDDDGYVLPEMTIHYHEIEVDQADAGCENYGQFKMFKSQAMSLSEGSKEKRESMPLRIDKVLEIVKDVKSKKYNEQPVIWASLNNEQDLITKKIKEVGFSFVSIYGNNTSDQKESMVLEWKNKEKDCFISKTDMFGAGVNMQQSHTMIHAGIDYKFYDFIQSLYRVYRFGQTEQVNIHIIFTSQERQILETLLKKWDQHKYLIKQMREIMKKYGLSITNIEDKLKRVIISHREEIHGQSFHAINNDNVLEYEKMEDSCIDLIHTSIPFSNHYEYTPTYNDFGHNTDNDKFFEQMDYLTPHLLRTLKPGRVCAVHVKDRILFGNATGTGMPTLDPFSDLTVLHFRNHGFQYFGRITILTDVVRENNATYRLGWSEQCKDGSKMGVGCPEYVLLFRKLPSDTSRAYADIPVSKSKEEYTRAQWQIDANGFWRSSGDRQVTQKELDSTPVDKLQAKYKEFSRVNIYDYTEHVDFSKKLDKENRLPASFSVVAPGSWSNEIWDDINRMKTLNTIQAQKGQDQHICPLQFDVVDRIINRYSNKGEIVSDPFAGLFTVPLRAIIAGRKGHGVELNPISYQDGVKYLISKEEQMLQPTLFDLIKEEEK